MIVFYAPLFELDGNTFFFLHPDYRADTLEEAEKIRIGCLLERLMFGLQDAGVKSFDQETVKYVRANLGTAEVAVISGPILEVAEEMKNLKWS